MRPPEIILRNSARCLHCGDEVESTHRHDFRTCGCGELSVDGGHDYIRRIGSLGHPPDCSNDDAVQLAAGMTVRARDLIEDGD